MHLTVPPYCKNKGIPEISMSKLNKTSESGKSPSRTSSKSVTGKEPLKLEVVKVIAPGESLKNDRSIAEIDLPTDAPAELPPDLPTEEPASAKSGAEASDAQPEVSEIPQVSTERLQPIPPATESMQYRAIGVVQGRYVAQTDSFSKGQLFAEDGTIIDAVLLGKVISIAKKRLDLEKSYLWVVYPRTRDKTGELHIQIAGVWAPVEMGKSAEPIDPGVEDGYFSVRGEVVHQSTDTNTVIVKVQRADQKKELDKSRAKFKLHLSGLLPGNPTYQFWDINVQRQDNALVIQDATSIAAIPRVPTRRPGRNDSKPVFKGKPTRRVDQYPDQRPDQRPSAKPVLKTQQIERNIPKPSRPVKRTNPSPE